MITMTENWAAISPGLGRDRAAWVTGSAVVVGVSATAYLSTAVALRPESSGMSTTTGVSSQLSVAAASAGAARRNHLHEPFGGRKAVDTAGVQPRGVPV